MHGVEPVHGIGVSSSVQKACLIPVDGFYQWKVPGGKIPYSISMKDDSPFVFAGLWEGWKDPLNCGWVGCYSAGQTFTQFAGTLC
jgi:putative SOS response-associated peptidase YedK